METLKTQQQTSFFFHDTLQTYGRGLKKLDQNEKNSTHEALVVALKTYPQHFLHFSRLFTSLENCWENFKTFSRIQDSVRTLKGRKPPTNKSWLLTG